MLESLNGELETLRARHDADPPIPLLRAARADALPDELSTPRLKALAGSEWTRALVEGLDAVDAPLDEKETARLLSHIQKTAREERRSNAAPTWFLWPVAAAVASLAIVAWISWRSMRQAPPSPSLPEATVAVAPAVRPEFQLPLDKPDVRLSTAVLTWRRGGGENDLMTHLSPALDAFRAGDYARSASDLAALEATFPVFDVFFYEGVSRLFLDDAQGALVPLRKAEELADGTFAADVAWYEAVAEERAGRVTDARARLAALCGGGGTRGARACEAQRALESRHGPRSPSP